MRILQIGADRSKRGILFPGTPARLRQEAYAREFGMLDIIGFSRISDQAREHADEHLAVHPTNSISPLLYGFGAVRIARTLPQPDVISVQDPFETGIVGLFIARMKGVPLHVQVHTDFLSPFYARASVLNRVRVVLADIVLPRAAGIRVVSNRSKEAIQKRYSLTVPIAVVPIFTDIEALRTTPRDQELQEKFAPFTCRILVVSRLEKEKNVGLAIDAFAQSAPADACLIVVGNGSQRHELEQQARERGITERVFFEGEQPAVRYYPLADLVLVPSLYEGYGLVIIEALASSVPVIATDVGVAREAGAIVASSEHFADALTAWFEHGPKEMSLKAYPYKNNEEYVQLYCRSVITCKR